MGLATRILTAIIEALKTFKESVALALLKCLGWTPEGHFTKDQLRLLPILIADELRVSGTLTVHHPDGTQD